MSDELMDLLKAAKDVELTCSESEEQRVSFAYGNTHFENEAITREMVREEAKSLKTDGRS